MSLTWRQVRAWLEFADKLERQDQAVGLVNSAAVEAYGAGKDEPIKARLKELI